MRQGCREWLYHLEELQDWESHCECLSEPTVAELLLLSEELEGYYKAPLFSLDALFSPCLILTRHQGL